MLLSLLDLAWAAGFIDGEGWIGITPRKDHHHKRIDKRTIAVGSRSGIGGRPRVTAGMSCRAEIHVTNRNPDVIENLHRIFPSGKVRLAHRKGRKEDYFVWSVTAYKIIPVLRALIPFLVGKKEVAIAAMEFQSWYDATVGPRGIAMDPARLTKALGFVRENKILNGRYSNHPRRLAA